MKSIIMAFVIVLTLFAAQPRPAHAGGSDPLSIDLSLIIGGLLVPTFEFIGNLIVPKKEVKPVPAPENNGVDGNFVASRFSACRESGVARLTFPLLPGTGRATV